LPTSSSSVIFNIKSSRYSKTVDTLYSIFDVDNSIYLKANSNGLWKLQFYWKDVIAWVLHMNKGRKKRLKNCADFKSKSVYYKSTLL